MPIYPYACEDKHTTDLFCKYIDKPDHIDCGCGKEARPQVTAPARTAGRWGDSGGGYDHSLGRHFNNSMEKERYCKANGLIALSDLGNTVDTIETEIHQQTVQHETHEKDMNTFLEHMKTSESQGEAWAKTFTVSNLKEKGLLDDSVNG